MGKAKGDRAKTNAMRELDAAHIAYVHRSVELAQAVSGLEVARLMGCDPDRTFKTLVTQGKSGEHYVFMVPVACELDLKRAAAAVGEKAIAMVRARELLPLTGYVHGGCSPIGMKKQFSTTIDETAQLYDTIAFSAGRIGHQLELPAADLARVVPLAYADITAR